MKTFVLLMVAPGVIFAEEQLPSWAQYGVLGLIIVATFVTKQVVPGWYLNDARQEIKDLKTEKAELIKMVFDTQRAALPALEAATQAVRAATEERRKRGG